MSDIALLKQHAAAHLPKAMQRELASQIDRIIALHALVEVASLEQTASLHRLADAVERAIDDIDQRLAPLERLTRSQQRELEAQIDLVLAHNRRLLDTAQMDAERLIAEVANRPTPEERSAVDRFMDGFTGHRDNWESLKRVWRS